MGREMQKVSVLRKTSALVGAVSVLSVVAACGGGAVVDGGGVSESVGGVESHPPGFMPRPEGFEGVWFETEPEGFWEKAVYKSQKYVGNPVAVGTLAEAGVEGPELRDLPNVCAPAARKAYEELGFTVTGTLDVARVYECKVVTHDSSQRIRDTPLSVVSYNLEIDKMLRKKTLKRSGVEFYENPVPEAAAECLARRDGSPLTSPAYSVIVLKLHRSEESFCKLAEYGLQFVINISYGGSLK